MNDMKAKKFRLTDWLLEGILLILIVVFSIIANNFLTIGNMWNIVRSISFKGIIACFATMLIVAGEMDLSVGSTVALAGVITAIVNKTLAGMGMNSTLSCIIGMIVTLVLSGCLGYMMSIFVTKLTVPSFIVTLAGMQIFKGAALIIANGFPIQGYPKWFKFLGSGYVGPVPFPAIVFIILLCVTWFIMRHTPFGRSIYAIGSNREAAKLSGIDVNGVRTTIFVLTSVSAGLAGILVSAQLNSGSPNVGSSYEMDVISSVIIGGASLSGGAGTIKGTLIGCIFLGVILNAMTLLGISDYWQYVIRGALILFAVFLNTMVRDRLRSKGL